MCVCMCVYVCGVEFQLDRPEPALRTLNERSLDLKRILSRIPDEIYDRRKFLDTIKYAPQTAFILVLVLYSSSYS